MVRVGDARPPPFTISTITYKVVVYVLAEACRYTPPISTLPLYLFCGENSLEGVGMGFSTYDIFQLIKSSQMDKVHCLSLSMKQNIENNDSRGNFSVVLRAVYFSLLEKKMYIALHPAKTNDIVPLNSQM